MNDVAATFLLTLDQNLAFYCTDLASNFLFNDYLQLTFDKGLVPLFFLVNFVLEQVDEELYQLVSDDGMLPTPIFTTSWILTAFAHDIQKFDCVQRIYDLVLASHPLIIIYLVAAVIVEHKEELEEHVEEY